MSPSPRGRRLALVAIASFAMALASPVAASAAKPVGASTIDLRDAGACEFDSTYSWANFGPANTPAYSIISLYFRRPGVADVLMDFSQQADNAGQFARAGTNSYHFNELSWLQGQTWGPGSELVAVGDLFVQPKNRNNYPVPAARAEATLLIPVACVA